MTRRRRIVSVGLKILAIFLVLLIYFAWPGRQTFTVSPETTYVTGPLDKDGYVDYVTALNERLSKGITPENNANVLIWRLLGPRPEGGNNMPAEYFKWLGIDPPPEQGNYFLRAANHSNSSSDLNSYESRKQFYDHLVEVAKSPWSASEEPELAVWLRRNEEPLALVIQASKRPNYYNPLVPNRAEDRSPGLIDARLPAVQLCRDLASCLQCRAMLRLGEGKTTEAWQDLLACHRLGRHLAHGGCLIEMLTGISIEQKACDAVVAFLGHAKLTSKRIAELQLDLQQLPPMPSVADKVDLFDRMLLLEIVLQIAQYGAPNSENALGPKSSLARTDTIRGRLFTRNVDLDPGLRVVNNWVDRGVAAMRLVNRLERAQEIHRFITDIGQLKRDVEETEGIGKMFMGPGGRGEFIGRTVVASLFPAADRIQTGADSLDQTRRNLRVAMALSAFHADAGRYPAKLEELAPKYLDKVPNDLFSDKPLIYKPNGNGYLLYGVGPNGKDDDGRTNDDDPRGDDIAVRIPAPPPRDNK